MDLQIAKRNGIYVHIDDVEKGLKCNCFCPVCNDKLVAKKGKTRRYHFSHISKLNNTNYCSESVLHLLSKEIIKKSKVFVLPPKYCVIDNQNYLIEKERIIRIDSVEDEKFINKKIKTDIFIISGEEKFSIEIYVSHKCGEEKIKELQKEKINTIEVDLSLFKKELPNDYEKILTNILINKYEDKKWLYSREIEEFKNKKQKDLIDKSFKNKKINSILTETNINTNEVKEIPLNLEKSAPLFCPNLKQKYIKNVLPLSLDYDCKNCPYFKGLKDNKLVLCNSNKIYHKKY